MTGGKTGGEIGVPGEVSTSEWPWKMPGERQCAVNWQGDRQGDQRGSLKGDQGNVNVQGDREGEQWGDQQGKGGEGVPASGLGRGLGNPVVEEAEELGAEQLGGGRESGVQRAERLGYENDVGDREDGCSKVAGDRLRVPSPKLREQPRRHPARPLSHPSVTTRAKSRVERLAMAKSCPPALSPLLLTFRAGSQIARIAMAQSFLPTGSPTPFVNISC